MMPPDSAIYEVDAMQREIPPELAVRLRRAADTFAQIGFEHARVEDLSAATGVPSSTIYYYLTGKEGLLAFLLSDWLDAVAASVERSLTEDQPMVDKLVAVVAAQLRLMNEHPATCRVLLAENGRIARLPNIAEAVQAAFHRPVEKVLREGLEAETLRAIDPEATTAAIFGAVTFSGLHYIVAGRDIPGHLAHDLAALVLDGMAQK
jgi:AcrR family transcriptional regulator